MPQIQMKPLGVKKPLRNFEPPNPGSDKKLEPSPPTLVSYKKKMSVEHWIIKAST